MSAESSAFRPHATRQGLEFAVQVVRADLANFFMLHHRRLHGFMVTGKNSGTHWLKYMLSCALAHDWGVEAPAQTSGPEGDAIIGHPRWAPKYPDRPRIGASHTIPSGAFAWPVFRTLLRVKPTVALVRDIRQAMLSNYLKWNYNVSMDAYVEGKPGGKKFISDAWWYVHFYNRWGDIAAAQPDRVLIVRYEDIQAQPEFWLRKVGAHYGFTLSDAAIQAGLQFTGRDAIRQRLGSEEDKRIVPDDEKRAAMKFEDRHLAVLSDIFRRHLRHDFGYGLVPGAPVVPPGTQLVRP
jgi:hypothetical protein